VRAHLPLAGVGSVTRRNAHDEGVECGELVSVNNGVVGLRGRVHLREDFLRQNLGNPRTRQSTTATHLVTNTYWKIVALPPAPSMPFLTDSATTKTRQQRAKRKAKTGRTLCNMTVHGVDNDGDLGRGHG
jgi:hypothetical protein